MRCFWMLATVVLTASTTVIQAVGPFEPELQLPSAYRSRRVSYLFEPAPYETLTMLKLKCAGCIKHIWMTTGDTDFRSVILRMYWDGEKDPSVEAPITDFFGVGHNMRVASRFASPCLSVSPHNGYNCYFPMPFAKSAKVTITNDQNSPVSGGVYFQADYQEYDKLPVGIPYFHAQWRRESPALRRARPYTILQAVGEGFVAGMSYHIRIYDRTDAWYHGGGDQLYIDGEISPCYIEGIGGEDYFGASWGIGPFISPYAGCTYFANVARVGRLCSMYRMYLEGPIRFERSIRLAFGAMANEITSVGYWYQKEPHNRFFKLPEPSLRQPDSKLEPGSHDIELLSERQLNVAVIGPFAGDIETKLPPETKTDLQQVLQTNYKGAYKTDHPGDDDRKVFWERARTTLSWLDFDALYLPKMSGPTCVQALKTSVSYALLRLHTKEAVKCRLVLGHDDPVRLWLNGKQLSDLVKSNGFRGDKIDLNLQEGCNDLLIKASNGLNSNWWSYAVSLSFSELKDVRFDDFTSLVPAQEYARP